MNTDDFPMPVFFDRYIRLVETLELTEALKTSWETLHLLPLEAYNALGYTTYAPGKWSIKDILQHLIDNERIMNYRALRFARGDRQTLAGYEESEYAAHALANKRTLEDLIIELKHVRQSSICLFKSLSRDMLLSIGTANNVEICPGALGFVIAGHQLHHLRIIEERYLPLL